MALWILQAYKEAKLKVSQALAKATSKLMLSFDGWTANNKVLDLLGTLSSKCCVVVETIDYKDVVGIDEIMLTSASGILGNPSNQPTNPS